MNNFDFLSGQLNDTEDEIGDVDLDEMTSAGGQMSSEVCIYVSVC